MNKPPEYFELSEVANFYTNLAREVPYPTRPEKPDRNKFKSHTAYGEALDRYEETQMFLYREGIKAYRQKQNEIEAEFKKELLTRLGIAIHPKADLLYAMAWEQGHASGFGDVAIFAESIAELLRD